LNLRTDPIGEYGARSTAPAGLPPPTLTCCPPSGTLPSSPSESADAPPNSESSGPGAGGEVSRYSESMSKEAFYREMLEFCSSFRPAALDETAQLLADHDPELAKMYGELRSVGERMVAHYRARTESEAKLDEQPKRPLVAMCRHCGVALEDCEYHGPKALLRAVVNVWGMDAPTIPVVRHVTTKALPRDEDALGPNAPTAHSLIDSSGERLTNLAFQLFGIRRSSGMTDAVLRAACLQLLRAPPM
jgi:hypothetical protein